MKTLDSSNDVINFKRDIAVTSAGDDIQQTLNSRKMTDRTTQMTNKQFMNASTITSAHLSTITLLNEPVKGQLLHFMIRSKDVHNRSKTIGGDLWFVTVSPINKGSFYTSGRVFDHQNGSYSAYVFAGWKKTAFIKIKLAYSSHAAYFMDKFWISDEHSLFWKAHYIQGNITESTVCYIETNEWNETVCAYPRPIAMGHRTAFVCNKPPSLPCDTFNDYIVSKKKTNAAMRRLGAENMWLFKG